MRICLVVCTVIPAEHSIGSSNHITVTKCFCILRLSRCCFCTIVTFSRNHSLISRDNLGIGVVHVNLDRVSNLSLGTVSVIQNNFGFQNTGSKFPVLLGNNLVIVVVHCIRIVIDCHTVAACTEHHHSVHINAITILCIMNMFFTAADKHILEAICCVFIIRNMITDKLANITFFHCVNMFFQSTFIESGIIILNFDGSSIDNVFIFLPSICSARKNRNRQHCYT